MKTHHVLILLAVGTGIFFFVKYKTRPRQMDKATMKIINDEKVDRTKERAEQKIQEEMTKKRVTMAIQNELG